VVKKGEENMKRFFALTLILFLILGNHAITTFANTTSQISVQTNKQEYKPGEVVSINGEVKQGDKALANVDVTFRLDFAGSTLQVDQKKTTNSGYSFSIRLADNAQLGTYTVVVQAAGVTNQTTFKVVNPPSGGTTPPPTQPGQPGQPSQPSQPSKPSQPSQPEPAKQKPNAVSSLKTVVTENQVTLSWSKVSGAEHYFVKHNNKIIYKGTSTSYTHKNLKANTSYTYSVIAVNSTGESPAKTINGKTKKAQVTTTIKLSKNIYKQKETVKITINLKDLRKKAIASANITTVITDPNGKKKTYTGKTNKSGQLVLTIKTSASNKIGLYKINTSTKFDSKSAYSNSSSSLSYRLNK
jgi:hypothetical protein